MTFSVIIVVLLCSVVQSVIGVGVLLFGTPTLLIMGYSYHETLYLILPSSILISILQTMNSSNLLSDTRYTYIYTLPMIVVGLLMVIYFYEVINIKYLVGGMLLFIGLIRIAPFVKRYLKIFLSKNRVLYHAVMGVVHGASNMGGGMLLLLMSTVHEKRNIALANIAYTYLLFGVIQMITLYLFSKELINVDAFVLAFISLIVYALTTKFIVKRVSDLKFNSLTTLLIISYGILSFIKI